MGTFTPVLDPEGADLASALQTIRELTLDTRLDGAVTDAFPGSRVSVADSAGIFRVVMHQRGLLRPLGAGELSDGTVRYLLWIAALLSERPPGLLVLNEPKVEGCRSCGVGMASRGRHDVRLVDIPVSGRPVRMVWRKRSWRCEESACPGGAFTEQDERLARARGLLTTRACW